MPRPKEDNRGAHWQKNDDVHYQPRLIVPTVVSLPVCASIVFLQGRTRDHPVADNRRCHDISIGEDDSSRVASSAIDTCNVLHGALPLTWFLLLRLDRGRAALPRSFEPAADVCLRASAALRGYMLDTAAVNSKREGCFLSAPTSWGPGNSMPFDVHAAGGWRHRTKPWRPEGVHRCLSRMQAAVAMVCG